MEKQTNTIEKHILFKVWLILLITIGILKILTIAAAISETPFDIYNVFAFLSNWAITICFIMLYRLRKWAFWGVALLSLYSLIVCIVMGFGALSIGFIIVAFVILLGVMQLKRNHISAWQALH